ncbi:MAG: hypothetical protein R6W74_07630 [Nitrosomonas halophila]
MRYLVLILLYWITSSHGLAESLSGLQRQTSYAYEQMRQTELEASKARKEVAAKEERWRYFKRKLAEAEQALQTAQKAALEADENMLAAKKKWDQYSETLYQEWHRQGSSPQESRP